MTFGRRGSRRWCRREQRGMKAVRYSFQVKRAGAGSPKKVVAGKAAPVPEKVPRVITLKEMRAVANLERPVVRRRVLTPQVSGTSCRVRCPLFAHRVGRAKAASS